MNSCHKTIALVTLNPDLNRELNPYPTHVNFPKQYIYYGIGKRVHHIIIPIVCKNTMSAGMIVLDVTVSCGLGHHW